MGTRHDLPPWPRRYQPAIAIGAFAVLIALLDVTLQSLGVFSAAGQGAWTVALEFQHVRCVGDVAVVTGPATLDFIGNSGVNPNSTISFKVSDFTTKSPSAAVTFQPTFDNQGHGVTLLPFKFIITQGDHYTISYLGGDGSNPGGPYKIGGSGFLRPTADGSHQFSFSLYPDRDTWEFLVDVHSLPSFTYPTSVQAGADHPTTCIPWISSWIRA